MFEEFREFFKGVFSLFSNEVKEERIKSYYLFLKDYDFEKVKEAVVFLVRNSKYPPSIAEIVNFIENGGLSEDDVAMLAWEKVWNAIARVGPNETVVFDDPFIHQALDAIGGWAKVGLAKIDEERMYRRDFLVWYKIFRKKKDLSNIPSLPGWREIECARGAGRYVDIPALIGDTEKAKKVHQVIYGVSYEQSAKEYLKHRRMRELEWQRRLGLKNAEEDSGENSSDDKILKLKVSGGEIEGND